MVAVVGDYFLIMEIWKDVPGYSGMYQVSNTGKIKSLSRLKRGRGKSMFVTPERILSGIRNKYGYLEVILHDGSTIKHHTIHRLVATAFIPNPESLPQINHKNEIKNDNRVENLEWCDAKYNMNYGTRTKRAHEIKKSTKN